MTSKDPSMLFARCFIFWPLIPNQNQTNLLLWGDAVVATKDCAAANGYLSVVKWLHRNRREGCTVSAMNWAAERGHLSVVKWLHHNRCARPRSGRRQSLKFLRCHKNGLFQRC